jgi:hypothetical protein
MSISLSRWLFKFRLSDVFAVNEESILQYLFLYLSLHLLALYPLQTVLLPPQDKNYLFYSEISPARVA